MPAVPHRSCPPAAGIRLPLWRQLKDLLRPAPLVLDADSLPEHLKRDVGLAGGRPAPRDPLRD